MSINLKIKVTKDILNRSAGCLSADLQNNCAIALAIKDIFPLAEIGCTGIEFYREYDPITNAHFNRISSSDLPKNAQDFILKFDDNSVEERKEMDEIEFEIKVPENVIQNIGDMEEVKRLISTSPTLELV